MTAGVDVGTALGVGSAGAGSRVAMAFGDSTKG